jgi:hypothetical protein
LHTFFTTLNLQSCVLPPQAGLTTKLMLAFVGAEIPSSESRGTNDRILLSVSKLPPTWRPRSMNFCPSLTGWLNYIARHQVSLFIAFYDSQGVGRVILSPLHTRNDSNDSSQESTKQVVPRAVDTFKYQIIFFILISNIVKCREDRARDETQVNGCVMLRPVYT